MKHPHIPSYPWGTSQAVKGERKHRVVDALAAGIRGENAGGA